MDEIDLQKMMEVDSLTQMLGPSTMLIVRCVMVGTFIVGAMMSHQKILRILLFSAAAYVLMDMTNIL